MRRTVIVFLLMLLLVPSLFGQTRAVVQRIEGKVQVKAPGRSWVPAKVGMAISKGSFISTGFKSSAFLEMGPSVINVKQLTRMQLEELIQKEGTLNTGLYLKVGKVRAQVKTTKGLSHDFKLRTPVSTAAVRGTDWETDGFNYEVTEGVIALLNRLGETAAVAAGQRAGVTYTGDIETPFERALADSTVGTQTGDTGTGSGAQYGTTGTVTITYRR